MKKILIKIKNNELIFKERTKLSAEYKNLLNTNVISSNELVFSDEYIFENPHIVTTFVLDLCKTYNVNTAVIENASLYMVALELFKKNPYITSLVLKEDISLSYALCEKIIATSITSVSCYNLQPFMLELFDKHGIIVESRNEILFLSNFMLTNNLNIFSSLFYKMTLKMDFPLSLQDEEDFATFCKINKYLKTIHVNSASLGGLENIVDTLRKNNKRNIKIIIHDNITDPKIIDFLKNFNQKKSKRYKIYFKLSYSTAYINENIVKHANSKILKTCGLIIIFIITITFGYVFYDNYASMQNVSNIKESLSKAIEITDVDQIIKDLNLEDDNSTELYPNEEDPDNTEENTNNTDTSTKKPNKKQVINKDLVSLLSINPETVGWLKVNNTNIDYPIVQTVNNEFYLKHNFYLEDDNNGWVFMDFRNEKNDLDDNTIFYAHNRYYSGVMFGTLQNTLRKSWYENEENHIITFRTLYSTYKFRVFSIYKIYKTNDYMSTVFASDEVRNDFYQMLKNRSVYDFGITPTGTDKIITLSTCKDGDNRIVLHAVLEEKIDAVLD